MLFKALTLDASSVTEGKYFLAPHANVTTFFLGHILDNYEKTTRHDLFPTAPWTASINYRLLNASSPTTPHATDTPALHTHSTHTSTPTWAQDTNLLCYAYTGLPRLPVPCLIPDVGRRHTLHGCAATTLATAADHWLWRKAELLTSAADAGLALLTDRLYRAHAGLTATCMQAPLKLKPPAWLPAHPPTWLHATLPAALSRPMGPSSTRYRVLGVDCQVPARARQPDDPARPVPARRPVRPSVRPSVRSSIHPSVQPPDGPMHNITCYMPSAFRRGPLPNAPHAMPHNACDRPSVRPSAHPLAHPPGGSMLTITCHMPSACDRGPSPCAPHVMPHVACNSPSVRPSVRSHRRQRTDSLVGTLALSPRKPSRCHTGGMGHRFSLPVATDEARLQPRVDWMGLLASRRRARVPGVGQRGGHGSGGQRSSGGSPGAAWRQLQRTGGRANAPSGYPFALPPRRSRGAQPVPNPESRPSAVPW